MAATLSLSQSMLESMAVTPESGVAMETEGQVIGHRDAQLLIIMGYIR